MADGNSIITNTGKSKMVKARAGMLENLPVIQGMVFGDGACDGTTIRAPLSTDTNLQNELLRQNIDSKELQSDGISVLYKCVLDADTLAGENINEIGLYDSDGDIISIKSFSNKGKDGDMKMIFSIVDEFLD